MAEDRIDDIVSPKALKQLDDLDAKLANTQKLFVDTASAAIQFTSATGSSKSLKEMENNLAKSQKAIIDMRKNLAQTELVEIRLQEARNKIAAKREAQLNKEIALEEKRTRTIISNSQAEVVASKHSTTGNLEQVSSLNAVDIARGKAANAATAQTVAIVENTKATTKSNLTKKQQAFLLAEEKFNLQRNTAELKNQVREANSVKGSLEQRRAALIRLNAVYDNQSPQERASASGRRLQTIIAGLNTQVLTLEKTTGRAQRNVGNYGSALGKAFNGLRSLAAFLPGIGLAGLIGLAIDPLFKLISGVGALTSKLRESTLASQTLGSAISSSEYTSAVKNVNELTINIDLARKGFLSKDSVLKQYNETIGLTTGQVTTLDEAEKELVKNGDSYIKMTLLKAAAQLALEEAAKKSLEAEKERQRSTAEGSPDKALQLEGVPLLVRLKVAFNQNNDALREYNKKFTNEAQSGSDKYINIAKKFQSDAAAIAREFEGGLFGTAKDDADAAKKRLEKQLAEAEKARKKREDDAKKAAEAEAKRLKEIDDLDAKYLNRALERLDQESKEELRQIINANEQVLALVEQSAQDQNLVLAKQFADGTLSAEEYAQKRVEIQRQLTIDTVNEDIKGLEFLIAKRREFGFETANDEKKLAELRQKLSRETTAFEIQDLERLAEKEAELRDKRKELRQEAANFGIALVQASFERQVEALTKEGEAIDIRKAKEIESVQRSILSEQEKADRIAVINAKAQGQREALERRQRQLDISRARFERQASIAQIIGSTAAAVAKALPNIPLSILVGAIGSVQLATAIAAPLPRFEKGGKMKRTGYAEYGHGTELRIDPDGKVSLTKSTPEVGLVKAGTQFISNKDLARLMAKPDPIAYAGGQAIDLKEVIASQEKSRKDIVGAINANKSGYGGISFYSTAKGRSYLSRNL